MKKIYKLYKLRNTVASIGIFDGVHRGHKKILHKLIVEAKRENAKSLVITFYPHPRALLNKDSKVPLLTSLEHRIRLIKDIGVDFLYVIRFTKSFSRIEPDDFIRKILVKGINIKALVVGKTFLFGQKGRGDFSLLSKLSREYGFRLFGVEPLVMRKRLISSTRVRHAIEKGDLKTASSMLGRPVSILGTVVRGRGVGRKLGFPTANINPHHEAIPPSGVYAVDVIVGRRTRKGILNIGINPTFKKNKESTIELHIFNFKKDIYAKDAEIIFKKKIRNEIKFDSVEALRKQIKLDVLKVS